MADNELSGVVAAPGALVRLNVHSFCPSLILVGDAAIPILVTDGVCNNICCFGGCNRAVLRGGFIEDPILKIKNKFET